ncbi:uncharacterized protein LOC106156895 [Lingula anatina]|uniref:Uncharacterized protein LOC106156895 n=1 Tax=Lingula anatina TaxID=7574 RepID=A0A1S3HP34_LINAN|nr:uncharacterized protein LOC106156895 [Lingula anatina]|eukprot:XP_013387790.1 uncharacterized protein LOC106156895 [Lingula anatina]
MEKYCTRIRDVWQNSGFEKEFPHAKLMLLEYFSPSGIHVTADPEYSPRRQKSAVWMKKMHPLVQNFYKDIRDKHSNITYITADTLVYKERENRLEETDCIVIYVPYKGIVPIKEHFFPKTYKGLPVDIRRGVFEFLVNERFEKRLKTGCSVSKFDEKNNHLGTIGMFVKCRQTNEVGLITAYHVVTGDKEVSAPSDVREPPEKKEILKLGLRERQSSDIGSSIASSNAGDARGNEKTTLIHQASCIDRANAQSESRLCAYVFDKIFYGNHPTHKLNFLKNIQVPVTLQGPVVPTGQGLETFSDDQLVSVVPDVGVDALFAPVFTIRAPTADFKDAANELPGYRLHQQLSFRNARVLPLEKLFGRPGAIESEDVMVYKNGCTTNLTQGKIRFFGSVAFPHDQNLLVRTPRLCGYLGNMTSVALNNLLEVERVTTGAGPSRVFADGGDSGSIVFSVNFPRDDRVGSMRDNSVGSVGDDHIDIVGMLVGRLTNTEIYVVTPIEAVFDALDVELLNDDDYNEIEVLWRYRNIKTKA